MAVSDLTRILNGYTENWTVSEGVVEETYKCDWLDRVTSMRGLLNSSHSDISAQTGYAGEGYVWLICTRVSIEAVGGMAAAGGPSDAMLSATFATLGTANWSTMPVQNATSKWREHWEGGGDAITLDEGFKFSDAEAWGDCTAIRGDVSVVKLYPHATITLTGKTDAVNEAAKANILDVIGMVNDAAFTIKEASYATQHLLFLGADLNEGSTSQDSDTYVITYKFAYQHNSTWNESWNKKKTDSGKIVPGFSMVIASDLSRPYQTATFTDLDPAGW